MKRYTWQDIIKENEKNIKLIGYGSLLNSNTHHSEHNWIPVIIKGFKRIYNLRVVPLRPTKKWLKFIKKYWKKYWIINKKTRKQQISKNSCVLNCIYTWNKKDLVNWLCINVQSSDYKSYSVRETQYYLYKTNFEYICPNTWKVTKTNEKAYVLWAKKEAILKKWKPFQNYHINTRKWAYGIWKYFWELFDKTTFNTKWKKLNNEK
jgi:hypothetical protein